MPESAPRATARGQPASRGLSRGSRIAKEVLEEFERAGYKIEKKYQ